MSFQLKMCKTMSSLYLKRSLEKQLPLAELLDRGAEKCSNGPNVKMFSSIYYPVCDN